MAGMNGIVFAGTSPAGRRLYEAGLAFQRAQQRPKISPPPLRPAPDRTVPAALPDPAACPPASNVRSKYFLESVRPALDYQGRPTIIAIINAVCEFFRVEPHHLLGPRRHREFIRPRHIGYFLAISLSGRSTTEVGRRFGNRDHTTIMYGKRLIERRLAADPLLRDQVEAVRAIVFGETA